MELLGLTSHRFPLKIEAEFLGVAGIIARNDFGFSSILPALQYEVRGQARIEKFVLNLCYMCSKFPEFVLPSTLCDKVISLGAIDCLKL